MVGLFFFLSCNNDVVFVLLVFFLVFLVFVFSLLFLFFSSLMMKWRTRRTRRTFSTGRGDEKLHGVATLLLSSQGLKWLEKKEKHHPKKGGKRDRGGGKRREWRHCFHMLSLLVIPRQKKVLEFFDVDPVSLIDAAFSFSSSSSSSQKNCTFTLHSLM